MFFKHCQVVICRNICHSVISSLIANIYMRLVLFSGAEDVTLIEFEQNGFPVQDLVPEFW